MHVTMWLFLQVKLGGCESDGVSDIHHLPGVFVMYNYARLISLLAKFDAAVTQGRYSHATQ